MKDAIKYDPKYSPEEWAEMVYNYEYNYAKQQIAKGIDVDKVLDQMSTRIRDKMILPEIQKIKKHEQPYNVDDCRKRYDEIMKNHKIKN